MGKKLWDEGVEEGWEPELVDAREYWLGLFHSRGVGLRGGGLNLLIPCPISGRQQVGSKARYSVPAPSPIPLPLSNRPQVVKESGTCNADLNIIRRISDVEEAAARLLHRFITARGQLLMIEPTRKSNASKID